MNRTSSRASARAASRATIAVLAAVLASGCHGSANTDTNPTSTSTLAARPPATSAGGADWKAIDATLRKAAAVGTFSGVVIAANAHGTLLAQGYGAANISTHETNDTETKFCAASMGKMFTAVVVGQLVEQGKLSFDDTIGTFVPGLPADVANTVTIAHLLTHTSGMDDVALAGAGPSSTLGDLVNAIAGAPLRSAPGSRFSYSNDGYIVLGAVIEKITAVPYATYIGEHVFKPAGMASTAITAYRPNEIDHMAVGYAADDTDGNGDRVQIASPSGGAYTTGPDMVRFAQALTNHTLLSASMTNTMITGKIASNRPGGPAIDRYGYGFADYEINGIRIVGHNGGTPGYEAQLDILPASGLVLVALSNKDHSLRPVLDTLESAITTR